MKRRNFLQLTALALIVPTSIPTIDKSGRRDGKMVDFMGPWHISGPIRFTGSVEKAQKLLGEWRKHWPAHRTYLEHGWSQREERLLAKHKEPT